MTGSPNPYRGPAAVLAAMLAVLTLAAAPARAGDCDEDGAGQGKGTTEGKFHIEERDGQKVYVIDKAITVCGKVPRPLVAYVLQARTINYQWETLKQDFLPKILESVQKEPF